jgi:hypothetical protein
MTHKLFAACMMRHKSPAGDVLPGLPGPLQAACLLVPPVLQLLPSLLPGMHRRSHAPAAARAPQQQRSANCMQGKHRAASGVMAKHSVGQHATIAATPPLLSCISTATLEPHLLCTQGTLLLVLPTIS